MAPPSGPTAGEAEADNTLEHTADFTLTDVTLSDTGTGMFKDRLRGLASSMSPSGRQRAVKAESSTKDRRHRLRPWQWVLIGGGSLLLILAILLGVDAGLYYDKVHYGVQVAGQDVSGMTSEQATQVVTDFAEQAKNQPITIKGGEHTWKVLPADLQSSIDVPAAVSKAVAVTRQGNIATDLGKKMALYLNGENLPIEGTVDNAKLDAWSTRSQGRWMCPLSMRHSRSSTARSRSWMAVRATSSIGRRSRTSS